MTYYKAFRNTVVDETGKQIAVIMPTNCTMKLAREMAGVAAQHANVAERNKQFAADERETAKRMGGFLLDFYPAPFLEGKDLTGAPMRFGRIGVNYFLCWAAHEAEPAGTLKNGVRTAAMIFGQEAVDAYIKAHPIAYPAQHHPV